MLYKTQDTRRCLKWKYVQLYAYACMLIRIYAKQDTRHKTVPELKMVKL